MRNFVTRDLEFGRVNQPQSFFSVKHMMLYGKKSLRFELFFKLEISRDKNFQINASRLLDLAVRIPQLGAKEGTQRYSYHYDSELQKLDRRKVLL